ncbi:MAG: hypothetical protein WCJ55_19685 [Chloroflexales bacterium]
MYILTIFMLTDDVDIAWQQAAPDKSTLESAAVAWMKQNGGWDLDEEEELSPEEAFVQVKLMFDNMAEGDDPRMILRKADG